MIASSITCGGDALHAGPSATLFDFCLDVAVHRRRKVRVIHSQSILVAGRGALSVAGPVACGGLWVVTAVGSSSTVLYVHGPHTYILLHSDDYRLRPDPLSAAGPMAYGEGRY